jgi:cell division protein FtsQ
VSRVAARRRTTARPAALAVRPGVPELARLVPSLRSLALGIGLLVLAGGAYAAARTTSLFAVSTLDVRGGNAQLRAQVRAALADEVGRSLVTVDGAAIAHRLDAVAGVRSFTYDRAFPHTLRVVVRREVPVLVVRRVPGADAFLVAASGRVLRMLPHSHLSPLPRLWVRRSAAPITVGDLLPPDLRPAAHTLGALRGAGLPGGVSTVSVARGELALTLTGGFQVRLGDAGDARLKLAIARRILRLTGAAAGGAGYVDVSVPERPVLDTNSQVGG